MTATGDGAEPMATEEANSTAAASNAPSASPSSAATPASSSSDPSASSVTFENVQVLRLREDGATEEKFPGDANSLRAEYDPEGMLVRVLAPNRTSLQEFLVKERIESARIGTRAIAFHLDIETIMIRFKDEERARKFTQMVSSIRTGSKVSVFKDRTEDSSAMQYFQFYGYLSQQQNMMQDYIRTSTYQKAILSNLSDFRDKVVLDVGAGSGILSFFAQQAGAKKVYAVEGSSIAKHAEQLVKANGVQHVIKVISGKIEEIELPEKVDLIISEPMGYMLLNERMLETYLHAKKWLKPEGKMFPSRGDLHMAPFSDEALYMEQINKVNFWYQDYFHGVQLSSLRDAAMKEYFRQPIVDTFDVRICMAKTQRHVIDFGKAHETDLHRIEIPLEFHMIQSGTVHGIAFWFDVAFIGSASTVWLSTAPTEPLTHWYQVRCLLEQPIFAKQGQVLTGKVLMVANMKQSYDVTIECQIVGTSTKSSNTLDLKNPYFRYTGVQPAQPPGENHTSPSENYWAQVDMQGARQAVNMVNGMIVDGLGHVSLDSGTAAAVAAAQPQQTATNLSQQQQPNIHQGSIPATGRKDARAAAPAAGVVAPTSVAAAAGGMAGANAFLQQQQQQQQHQVAAPTSLPYSQLIGGGISPNVMAAAGGGQSATVTTPTNAAAAAAAAAAPSNLMIGDYVQGNLGYVLGSPAAAAQAAAAAAASNMMRQ